MRHESPSPLRSVTAHDAHTGPPVEDGADAECAGQVIELLEVLWERGRAISAAPVSPAQLRVMYILEREDGINLRTLGEAIGASAPSASRLCDRLHAVGFIARVPNSANRREKELRLSEEGRKYLRELRARRETDLLRTISAMRPAARAALLEGLSGFRDAAQRAARPPGTARAGNSATA